MKILLSFSAGIDRLSFLAARLAIWLVLFCALVSAFNALSRYTFDLSSNAWLELQWYMFAGIVLLGAPHLLNTNGHIRVDIFYSRLSDRQRVWLDLGGMAAFVLPFAIFMLVTAWPWFVESWVSREVSSNAGGLLRWPVKLLLPLGFGLLIMQSISEIIKRCAALQGQTAVIMHYEKPLQ